MLRREVRKGVLSGEEGIKNSKELEAIEHLEERLSRWKKNRRKIGEEKGKGGRVFQRRKKRSRSRKGLEKDSGER